MRNEDPHAKAWCHSAFRTPHSKFKMPGLPRQMQSKLPLLPSGPGGVRKSTVHGPWRKRICRMPAAPSRLKSGRRLAPRAAPKSSCGAEIRRPKPENRKKAEIRNPTMAWTDWLTFRCDGCGLGTSGFGLLSAFGPWVSALDATEPSLEHPCLTPATVGYGPSRRSRWWS